MSQSIPLIANFTSGRGRCATQIHEVIRAFAAKGYGTDVHVTSRRGHATELAMEYAKSGLLTCAGGDGTLNEVITGVMRLPKEERPTLGYIPCGSTNDFAATLGLPGDMAKAAQRIMEMNPITLDVGRYQDRYFSYVASFGAFTEASYSTPQDMKNALGHFAYVIEGVRNLQTLRPYAMRFEADGQVYEGDYLFGAISNSTSIAGLVKLDEELVKLNDGLLELLLIRYPQSLDELGRVAICLNMQNYDHPAITLVQAKKIVIDNPDHTPFTLDGEYGSDEKHIVIENVHHAIRLMA